MASWNYAENKLLIIFNVDIACLTLCNHLLFYHGSLNANNDIYVEPDISVICDKNKLTDEGCKGAPDWIIEIVSPSSRAMDYNKKLFKYRTAGVREYWIVDPMKQ